MIYLLLIIKSFGMIHNIELFLLKNPSNKKLGNSKMTEKMN